MFFNSRIKSPSVIPYQNLPGGRGTSWPYSTPCRDDQYVLYHPSILCWYVLHTFSIWMLFFKNYQVSGMIIDYEQIWHGRMQDLHCPRLDPSRSVTVRLFLGRAGCRVGMILDNVSLHHTLHHQYSNGSSCWQSSKQMKEIVAGSHLWQQSPRFHLLSSNLNSLTLAHPIWTLQTSQSPSSPMTLPLLPNQSLWLTIPSWSTTITKIPLLHGGQVHMIRLPCTLVSFRQQMVPLILQECPMRCGSWRGKRRRGSSREIWEMKLGKCWARGPRPRWYSRPSLLGR